MAREFLIQPISSGVQNRFSDEIIDRDASSNSLNWIVKDDGIELTRGRLQIGDTSLNDGIAVSGHHVGYRADGTPVHLKKDGDTIFYLNTAVVPSVWVSTGITGLDPEEEVTFSNYTSLAGYFAYVGGNDILFKIVLANPASAINVADPAKNSTGFLTIDTARMFLWNTPTDKTGLYVSWIDAQNYTTVASQAVGASGSTNYTGTLNFKAGNPTASAFAVRFTDGTQVITDDRNGNLIGDGTGTINYATGAFNVTFNAITTGAVTVGYQWENSNDNGITDFTFSSPRVPGEGDVFRQDIGGDKILTVLSFEGKQYSIKERSVYELFLTPDDTNATNLVYRTNIGVQWHRSAVSTSLGIMFMDTGNLDEPALRLITRNPAGDGLDVVDMAPKFDFSKFDWERCAMETWGQYLVFSGKTKDGDRNDRVFRYNYNQLGGGFEESGAVSIVDYSSATFVKIGGNLFSGDSLSGNVFEIFSGFDDDTFTIDNFWEGKNERYDTERLKKYKWLRVQGLISDDMKIKLYMSLDDEDFFWIGTIDSNGPYVDQKRTFTIGGPEIGESTLGGGTGGDAGDIDAYKYFCPIKLKMGKFRKRKYRFVAEGIGFARIEMTNDYDIRLFQNKMPYKYRPKQNVSLDGEEFNLPNPQF